MRRKLFCCCLVALVVIVGDTVGRAVPNGAPDANEHPYVGQVFFYIPDEIDTRFTDPGAWFSCSGTLISPTLLITAGHCTYGTGLNGEATTGSGGSGGNDVWVNFGEEPDLAGLPPSADYIPDDNEQRYLDREAYFDAHPDWIRGTAYPHPEHASAPFLFHDVGIVVLDEPVTMASYGALPRLGYLDQFFAARRNAQRFTVVGYGLTRSRPTVTEGGDSRQKGTVMLINLQALGVPPGFFALFTSNSGRTHQGGICFGDSGGPVLVGGTNVIVGVSSFILNQNCTGAGGAYRIDQQDDLDFIASFFSE
jgi:hypothetical protein